MPVSEAEREAAKKRRLDFTSVSQSTPQQGQTANAGTQQTVASSTASTTNPGKAIAAPNANAPAAAAKFLAVEPMFRFVSGSTRICVLFARQLERMAILASDFIRTLLN